MSSKDKIPTEATKESSSSARNWTEMTYEILGKIFMALNLADLATVSLVSHSCRQACGDPSFWNQLDLSRVSSNSFSIPKVPYAWSDECSSTMLTQFLNNALSLSNGKIGCLIFHFFACLKDEHLISVARRSPNLKRLVLPGRGYLSKTGVHGAMQLLGNLESVTMPFDLRHNHLILSAIGKYCKNFHELKIACCFDIDLAKALIKHTPNLKALSLRCTEVDIKALSRVLNCLKHLEVVNICHSLIIDKPNARRNHLVAYQIYQLPEYLNASCLKKLITCEESTCIRCNSVYVLDDDPAMNESEFQELIWREDEISSLAH